MHDGRNLANVTRGTRHPPMSSRREFLRGLAYAGLAVPSVSALLAACDGDEETSTGRPTTSPAQTGSVNMVSWGGTYNEALDRAYIQPFTEQTGIEVILGENTSLETMQLQVESGNVEWDVVELTGSQFEIAVQDDLVEPFDFNIIDASNTVEFAVRDQGVKYAFFPFVMAWDERVIDSADAPQRWVDFFDLGRFPGRRSLYDAIGDGSILEAALLADGVAPDAVYPLDVQRALAFLDRFGQENIIWHSTNQEPILQLTSGEVPLATAFSGRVVFAREEEDAPLNFTLNESWLTGDYLVVPKGAPNRDLAFQLINHIMSSAASNAEFTTIMRYPTANTAAAELIPAEILEQVPSPDGSGGQVLVKDDSWWTENLESANEQFLAWQVGN